MANRTQLRYQMRLKEPTLIPNCTSLGIPTLTLVALVLAVVTADGQELRLPDVALERTCAPACLKADSSPNVEPSQKRFERLGLSFVRSYVPGKIPVVFVHGLWGSPVNWTRMIDALEADHWVRERFQFLTFGYSGGGPITHVAYLLRRDLRILRNRLDPHCSDPAWDRMVLVGHSLGGILCKMMIQHSGSKLWDLTADRSFEKLAGPADARELLKQELIYEPLTNVQCVIFINTPHRGSRLVSQPIKRIDACLVKKPEALQQAWAQLLAWNPPSAFAPAFRAGFPTCLEQIAWEHPLLLAIDALPGSDTVTRHSIIADQRRPARAGGTDGFVEYASAHQQNVSSELLVTGGHFGVEYQDTISEVARVLKEHATH